MNRLQEWLTEGIPLGDWASSFVDFIGGFTWIFDSIHYLISLLVGFFEGILLFETETFAMPPWLIILILAGLAYWSGKKWTLAVFTLLGLGLIWNLGFWENMVYTLSLVLTAAILSIVVGVPIGIWASRREIVRYIVTPILDFMQTMPAFVYLIPAIFFFSIGTVPGVIASFIFAVPPTIRLTILGIQQVPAEIIEASNAFGSTSNQKLFKVQLPLAKKTIMAGINQTIMLALSMVVIASMVGARGLGRDVYYAVSNIDVALGVESGLSIVILAILLDRLAQNLGNK